MANKKMTVWQDASFFVSDYDYVHCYTHYNCAVELHAHSFFELNIICDGTGIHHVYNTNINVKKGNVFIIPPNTPHSYKDLGNLTVDHILINDKFFSQYEKELALMENYSSLFKTESFLPYNIENPSLFFSDEDFEAFNSYWKIISSRKKKEHQKKSNNDLVLFSGLALSIIAFLCSVYKRSNGKTVKDEPYSQSISKAIQHITNHYDEKISIEDLSALCAMSKSSFTRTFKKILHTTPADYIVNQRITHAKILLKNNAFSIAQIAQETGFFDSAHFTKTFKKITGKLPVDYRKS